MERRKKVSGSGFRKKGGLCFLFFIALIAYGVPCHAAQGGELPDRVVCVEDESELIADLIRGMKKHKRAFFYYYDGMERTFAKYEKNGYRDFFDKVARKDGYRIGILSGACITVCGECPKYLSIQVCYLTTKSQEKKIDRKVAKLAKKLGTGNRASRILRTHDYLVRHMHYDARYYSPYDAFMKGRGMCMAYALAFQRIMQEMKIPCLYVKGGNHAWNMVQIGKYWYNIDVTWDDSTSSYRYFLKCDRDFSGHKRPAGVLFKGLAKAKKSFR